MYESSSMVTRSSFSHAPGILVLLLVFALGLAAAPALAAERTWSAADRPRVEQPATKSAVPAQLLDDLRARLDRPAVPAPKGVTADPLFDTFGDGTHDIVELTADVVLDVPVIIVTFSAPVTGGDSGLPNAVVGFVDVDADQNGVTGDAPATDGFNPAGPVSGMGNEFFVDLFSYSSVDDAADVVDDVNNVVVGRTPVLFGGNQMAVILDPTLIGMDDGAIDVATVLGSLPTPTDVAPNAGSEASDTSTLLQGVRFRTSIEWRRVPNFPTLRPAIVSDFRTLDSANFFFNNPNNLEFLIKVLDGCNNTGHFWVFFAGATDVEFTVTVEDTATGQVEQYFNPQGQPANAVTDTMAFATCP